MRHAVPFNQCEYDTSSQYISEVTPPHFARQLLREDSGDYFRYILKFTTSRCLTFCLYTNQVSELHQSRNII